MVRSSGLLCKETSLKREVKEPIRVGVVAVCNWSMDVLWNGKKNLVFFFLFFETSSFSYALRFSPRSKSHPISFKSKAIGNKSEGFIHPSHYLHKYQHRVWLAKLIGKFQRRKSEPRSWALCRIDEIWKEVRYR